MVTTWIKWTPWKQVDDTFEKLLQKATPTQDDQIQIVYLFLLQNLGEQTASPSIFLGLTMFDVAEDVSYYAVSQGSIFLAIP